MTNETLLRFADGNYIPSMPEGGVGDVCVPNISPKERQLRKRFAIVQFMVTLAVLAVMLLLRVDPLWRLGLFFLFSAATTSYMQALDKT